MDEMPTLSSRVRIHYGKNGNAELLGFAELVVAGAFVIKDIRIVRSLKDGGSVFVSFPERRGKGDAGEKWFGVAHPISSEAYRRAAETILEAYEREAGKA